MTASRPRRHHRRRDERGAVAILMAFSLTTVLIGAGLVIDFGLARYEKEINKSAADAGAMAGIQALDPGDGLYHPWRGICSALAYLQANNPALSELTGSYRNGAGSGISGHCAGSEIPNNTACVANTPTTWGWFEGTTPGGKLTIEIRSGYSMPDARFADDTAQASDSGDVVKGGCDQVAVIVTRSDKPGLGSLATTSDLTTRVRSVARLSPNSEQSGPVALLLLERHNCLTLLAGSQNTYIDLMGNGNAAGSIHSDSLGDYTGNGSLCNSGNKVLYGKFSRHVIAHRAEVGNMAGTITTAALSSLQGAVAANATDGSANVCAEQLDTSCAPATGRSFVGRGPVDTRYLNGVRTAMTAGSTATNWSTATATANGYTVWTPSGSCNNLTGTPPTTGSSPPNSAVRLFVNCPGGASFKDFTIANATSIVFNGSVSVSSGNTLAAPNAQRFYVKGTSSGTGLSVQGSLALNTGTTSVASNSGAASICGSRTLAARNQLIVANGAFSGGAQATFHLCNTTVLMADGWNGSTGCALPATVTPISTEPYDGTCYGYLSLGGQGFMEWTAPSLLSTTATQTDWDSLEDLALWTETSGTISSSTANKIGGGGLMSISGVFFLPNANPFVISGGGLQSNGANAQFIARRLEANGSGTLHMRPNPADVVTIPLAPTYSLVR
jgi:hypothetical protein